jgi:hypothetical protein
MPSKPHILAATKKLPRACGHCMWWEPVNSVAGQCRRRAPHPTPMEMVADGHYWPITRRETWCGDYERVDGKDIA